MKDKRMLRAVLLTFAAILILINIVPIPIRMQRSAFEIDWRDGHHDEEKTVIINGWYRVNVFTGNHRFNGSVKISEYPETHGALWTQGLTMTRVERPGRIASLRFAIMTYRDESRPEYIPLPFGTIYATAFFRHVYINVWAEDRSSTVFIVTNAISPDDAVLRFQRRFQ